MINKQHLAVTVAALLLCLGCGRGAGPQPPAPSPAPDAQMRAHVSDGLRQLQAMNTAAAQKDWATVRKHWDLYLKEYEVLRPALDKADPAIAKIIAGARDEVDHELKKEQPYPGEFDEEATKVARQLARLAPQLGVSVDPSLLPPPDKVALPPYDGEITIQVAVTDYAFKPERIPVKKGNKVTLHLTNTGAVEHELELDGYGVEVEHIKPGASADLVFVAEKAGTFAFGCHLPGHFEAGMQGELVVQ